jgi:putative acetyltransferase
LDNTPHIHLVTPGTPEMLDATRDIFREYADSLGIDLGFQNFDEELACLPGDYEAPGGLLLLAYVDDELAGCGGFRPLPEADHANACEMKRLFVRRPFRRFGIGRIVAKALMNAATESGYSTMLLDTLDDMEAARGLYASLGFEEVAPYYFNPIAGAHYLKADLHAAASRY